MADQTNPAFYPRVGNIRPKPRSPLQQAEMRERPLDAAMGALKSVLDKGSEMLDATKATPFDVSRNLVSAIPFVGPNLAKQFEQSNVNVPIGYTLGSNVPELPFGSKTEPVGRTPQGVETFEMPTKDLMSAIKWSDLAGTAGAGRAAQSLGYGEAPDPFDVIDAATVGAGALGAARMAPKAARATGRGAKAGANLVGQAISDAMIHQAGPLASGPLSALAPRTAMTNVVKPKGGNWLAGSVENVTKPLRNKVATENIANYTPEQAQQMTESGRFARNDAINNWIDRNLANYIKKEMGTPEDPVRKLAEQGIVHMPPEQMGYGSSQAEGVRKKLGTQQLGQSPEAQAWENATDVSMYPYTIEDIKKAKSSGGPFNSNWLEPWMENADQSTKVYSALDNMHAHYLGFDHIVDVLKQDLAEGRIRPEQLSKVSMEQAVRRVHEFDQEQARKMMEAQLKEQEGFPLHKEYPEGYKWIELTKPKGKLPEGYSLTPAPEGSPDKFQLVAPDGRKLGYYADEADASSDAGGIAEKKLADALKYEGDTMGHCVGGYCPDVLEGRSRIFSLRDKKGEPHVTIEVQPNKFLDFNKWYEQQTPELREEIQNRARRGEHNMSIYEAPEYLAAREALPPVIKQIKGKQNRAPKEEYLPYVQDFVRSGEWSDVGDLRNTGLVKYKGKIMSQSEADDLLYQELNEGMPGITNELGLTTPPEAGMAAGGKPPTRYPTEKEREAMRKLRESFVPAATEAERLKRLYDNMDKSNKKVSFSDNPDTMMMEVEEAKKDDGEIHMSAAGSVADAIHAAKVAKAARESVVSPAAVKRVLAIKDHEERAVQAQKLIEKMYTQGQVYDKNEEALRQLHKAQTGARALPTVIPRARPKTKEEIREYAQRTADQLNAQREGKFFRASPEKSENPAGKSYAQWKMEQELNHDVRPLGTELDKPQVANIEDQLGSLKMGISGDTTIADSVLHRAGPYELSTPVEQQGGPLYGLRVRPKPVGWASNEGVLSGVQGDINLFSEAYGGVPVIGQYNAMGPSGSNFAQHLARSNLNATDISGMNSDKLEKFNDIIKKGNAASGPHPDFPGIQDPSASTYLGFFPELRKYYNALMMKPEITKQFGLPDGRVIQHAITVSDLRDMPVLTSGHSQFELVPGHDPKRLPLSEHSTYSHDLPRKEGSPVKQTPFPIPAEFEFSDVKEYAEPMYKPEHMTRVYQTASPRQIIDQQHIDEIKAYEDFMRQYAPEFERKKRGGAIHVKPKKMANGGEITAEDLEIEERPL